MKAAILTDVKKLVVTDVPDPILEKDEVLIQVQYCGICGSDLHIYSEGLNLGLGHECSGSIVKLGPVVNDFVIGERVVLMPSSCGECYWCKRGEIGLCDKLYTLKTSKKVGAFATYIKAESKNLHRLSNKLTFEQGAIVEPTAIAVHAINLSGIKRGDVVAVLGLGPIGQLIARLAKLYAKTVYATDIHDSRIRLAATVVDKVLNTLEIDPIDEILALNCGIGPDIIFECAGVVETTQESIALAKKKGTIIIPGMCFEGVETSFIDIVLKELTVRGSLNATMNDFISAYNLIENKSIDVKPLLQTIFPLSSITDAFESALKGEGGKILVKP